MNALCKENTADSNHAKSNLYMKFLHPATVDLISSSSPNPIDMIGQIDSGFGLLSTIAKINEYHEADNPNLDLRDFVIDLRKKMACEESFCGKDHTASEKFELSKIQQSERLITKKVETHNLQADHRTRIWPKQYHDEWNPLGNGKYQVKKIFSEIKEQPLLVPEIHNILNKPNINYSKTLTKYLVQHANCITDPELFLSRFNFTSKFLRHSAHIFEYGKIRDGLGELSNKYDIEMSFPLVGALRIGEE
ncbi:MAG: hypothetical protein OEY10_07955, partial [Nitrosopumilus sp.]|nr:hypothetical protein [Nitrosopumilus sp.]